MRPAKIAANQDGEDELVEAAVVAVVVKVVVVAAEGSRVETLGSDSNFSDLDLNRFESSENLPFFFQYDPAEEKLAAAELVVVLVIDDVAGPT